MTTDPILTAALEAGLIFMEEDDAPDWVGLPGSDLAGLRAFAAILTAAKDARIKELEAENERLSLTESDTRLKNAAQFVQLSAANEALKAEREVRGLLETQGRFLLGSIAEIRAALDPSKLRVVREFRAALAAAQALDKKEE